MKILLLTDQTYLHGGIEKVLSQKANWFADIGGKEVFIVTHNQRGKIPVYSFSPKIKMLDLNINYEVGVSYFHPKNLLKARKHKSALKKMIKKIAPDVIISCSFGPDFYFLPDIERQTPKIKEFHSSRYFHSQFRKSLKEKILYKLSRNAERKYHQLVVLNEDEKMFYYSDKTTVIPNPVETSDYTADVSQKRILAAGRISPIKNFGALICAFSKICIDFPEWELHFYGEDYLQTKENLQEQINRLGIMTQVKFQGVTSNLKKEMQNYSIYAMTSETECFPMVLLESLSVGLPVVSYDSPTGPKNILTAGSDSLLVPYKNLDIFTEKLQLLMENENLRKLFGENGKRNVERFEISKVMKQWECLFAKLIM